MKEPNESDYGFTDEKGWPTWESEYEFLKAYRTWDKQRKAPKESGGRPRTRPIHPSWEPVLKHFDSTNPQRSQGAFCRWAGLNRGTFSAMQCKPLLSHTEYLISQWVEEIECVDFGIMPQFQSEYERLMEKD